MSEGDHQRALLLQAADEAVAEFQAGRADPSVEDILHLEKRFAKLPGAPTGRVALEDAKGLLGSEVLADEPLEFVVAAVLGGGGGGAPAVLTKRQFLNLAHVAEVAQGRAFDLVTAEDAQRCQTLPAAHKKRPPAIRDAHIDTWRIGTLPAVGAECEGEQQGEPAAAAAAYDAAAALAAGAPGPLQATAAGAGLSRAVSLTTAGPLQHGAAALSRQNSECGDDGDEEGGALAAALAQRGPHCKSGATSYQSAVELHSDVEEAAGAEDDGEVAEAAEGLGAAVEEFTAKLNGLMHKIGSDKARAQLEAIPPTPEGALAGGDDTAAAEAAAPPAGDSGAKSAGQVRGSWESFNSGTPNSSAAAAAAALAPALAAQATPLQGQPGAAVDQAALVQAAMAAGMTFMQQLQAAGAAGGAQPSPFADINPLRAVAAAAAAAASPAISAPSAGTAAGAASPEVRPAGSGPAAADAQQLIAQLMARMNMGEEAPAEQLAALAAQLQQQAAAKQRQAGQAQPAASLQGSVGSHGGASSRQQGGEGGAAALRKSWHAFQEDAPHYHPGRGQQEAQEGGREEPAQPAAPDSPSKLARLAPPPGTQPCGIAGWSAMSREDVQRCEAIFTKKGYPAVGGMERHSAMEYFAKLHMQRHVFQQAWQAADLGADGKLDCREFCLFVQLLRGAQKGWPLPARLAEAEAAALLGEAPMPAPTPATSSAPTSARGGQQQQGAALHIDSARLRAALAGGHSRQGSMEHEQSVIQDDSDGASSIDSGIAESVSGLSVSSRPSQRPGANPYALGRPGAPAHHRLGGLGSVLGGGAGAGGASAVAGAYHPAASPAASGRFAPAGAADVAHSLLEVALHSAQIRYRKPLSTPIFTVSVRDSLGRLVELPIDTHPGHYRKETATIHSSAIVRLTSQLRSVPPGSVLFLEIKHWKGDKRRFSTLAWSYAPLDRLVDFGQHAARVRGGPVDLPLFRKPMDLTLRKMRRLTSRAFDLHLSVRGVE